MSESPNKNTGKPSSPTASLTQGMQNVAIEPDTKQQAEAMGYVFGSLLHIEMAATGKDHVVRSENPSKFVKSKAFHWFKNLLFPNEEAVLAWYDKVKEFLFDPSTVYADRAMQTKLERIAPAVSEILTRRETKFLGGKQAWRTRRGKSAERENTPVSSIDTEDLLAAAEAASSEPGKQAEKSEPGKKKKEKKTVRDEPYHSGSSSSGSSSVSRTSLSKKDKAADSWYAEYERKAKLQAKRDIYMHEKRLKLIKNKAERDLELKIAKEKANLKALKKKSGKVLVQKAAFIGRNMALFRVARKAANANEDEQADILMADVKEDEEFGEAAAEIFAKAYPPPAEEEESEEEAGAPEDDSTESEESDDDEDK